MEVERLPEYEIIKSKKLQKLYPLLSQEQTLLRSHGLLTHTSGFYSTNVMKVLDSQEQYIRKWREWYYLLKGSNNSFPESLEEALVIVNDISKKKNALMTEDKLSDEKKKELKLLDKEFDRMFEILVCLRNSPEFWFSSGGIKDPWRSGEPRRKRIRWV